MDDHEREENFAEGGGREKQKNGEGERRRAIHIHREYRKQSSWGSSSE